VITTLVNWGKFLGTEWVPPVHAEHDLGRPKVFWTVQIDSLSLLSPDHSLSPLPNRRIVLWTAEIGERVPRGQYSPDTENFLPLGELL